jgi:hypothetical protein
MKTTTLAKLVGSEKQVAWADSIRAKQMREMLQVRIDKCRANLGKEPMAQRALTALESLQAEWSQQAQSSWWIDNNQQSPSGFAVIVSNAIKALK